METLHAGLVALIIVGLILAWWAFAVRLWDQMCEETATGRLPQSLSRREWIPGLRAMEGLRIGSAHFYRAAAHSEALGLVESRERPGGPERDGCSFLEYRRIGK